MKAQSNSVHYVLMALCLLLHSSPTVCVIVAKGDGAVQTFSQAVVSKLFDRATGSLYLGLAAGAGTFALSKAVRVTNTSERPVFTGIATNTILNGMQIQLLARAAIPT